MITVVCPPPIHEVVIRCQICQARIGCVRGVVGVEHRSVFVRGVCQTCGSTMRAHRKWEMVKRAHEELTELLRLS